MFSSPVRNSIASRRAAFAASVPVSQICLIVATATEGRISLRLIKIESIASTSAITAAAAVTTAESSRSPFASMSALS